MTPARQPLGRRLVTAILGIDRRPVRRELPLGRRILASALGIGVRPPLRSRRVSDPAVSGTAAEETGAVPERTPGTAPGRRNPPRAGRRPWPPGVPYTSSWRGSGSRLLTEDRPDFERLLDSELSDAKYTVGAGPGQPAVAPEQLRTLAIGAAGPISASASAEYERYVMLRSAQRGASAGGTAERAMDGISYREGSSEPSGAGLGAVLAVLAPVLAGTAAVLFLLVGYLLQLLDPDPSLASQMRRAGWLFALFTAAAIVVAVAALVVTALRGGGPPNEVDSAREEWRRALLERGIRPFLEEATAGEAYRAARRAFREPPVPRIGYSRPSFSGPDDDPPAERPRFSSPDYTSPDFGGGERERE